MQWTVVGDFLIAMASAGTLVLSFLSTARNTSSFNVGVCTICSQPVPSILVFLIHVLPDSDALEQMFDNLVATLLDIFPHTIEQ